MTTPLEEMERQWRGIRPASEELERWCVYLKRCYVVQLGRLSKIPEAGARQALRRLLLRVARTEYLPLKETLAAAVDRLDEENLKRFILRLGAEMKSKNWGWGKRWIDDDVNGAILKLWDGIRHFPCETRSCATPKLAASFALECDRGQQMHQLLCERWSLAKDLRDEVESPRA